MNRIRNHDDFIRTIQNIRLTDAVVEEELDLRNWARDNTTEINNHTNEGNTALRSAIIRIINIMPRVTEEQREHFANNSRFLIRILLDRGADPRIDNSLVILNKLKERFNNNQDLFKNIREMIITRIDELDVRENRGRKTKSARKITSPGTPPGTPPARKFPGGKRQHKKRRKTRRRKTRRRRKRKKTRRRRKRR